MQRRIQYIWIMMAGMIILLDPLVFISLKAYAGDVAMPFSVVFWLIPAYMLARMIFLIRNRSFFSRNPRHQKAYFNYFGLFILFYLPKIVFLLFVLTDALLSMIVGMISPYMIDLDIIGLTGMMISAGIFLLILYGILYGRFHFKREQLELAHDKVPEVFEGFRIVQISDLHIGSWVGHRKQMQRAVDMINRQKADIIVLTGDLFNNYYEEISEFRDILGQLQARTGKYAILGNHDYGDYFYWSSEAEYQRNFHEIKQAYRELGFELLLNESVTISRDNATIGIAGVENWGLPPFHQYGDLEKALSGLNGSAFNILLSHDPSHWNEEILTNGSVQLTLSGHTHGMQFGVFTPVWKWSPAKAKYREWGGLYSHNDRFLYVNKGLGYIGFPGRIGIRPEITVINLRPKKGRPERSPLKSS